MPNNPLLSASLNGKPSSPEGIKNIVGNAEPVLRNLQITLSYHQITLDFAGRLGSENVCWAAFATWASKQAGQFIRMEQVPPALLEHLGLNENGAALRRPWYWFLIPKWLLRSRRLQKYARLTIEDISRHIARGNLLVFSKLAPIFGSFIAMVRDLHRPEPETLDRFLRELSLDPSTHEEIKRAFALYYAAVFEENPKTKAELCCLANLLIGKHEQIRLQETIGKAIGAPIRSALDDPEYRWDSLPVPLWVRRSGAALVKGIMGPAIRRFEARWQTLVTQMMMTLATPSGTLQLGADLPPLPDGTMYPPDLQILTLPELVDTLKEWDYTPDTITGSGAKDWTDLKDRMNFIADLFRSRQQDPALFSPPFSPQQMEKIIAGSVPEGRL